MIEAGGADVNHPSTRLETALYLAALEGHVAIVKILISHGADIDQPATEAEQTPLMVMTSVSHIGKIKFQCSAYVYDHAYATEVQHYKALCE